MKTEPRRSTVCVAMGLRVIVSVFGILVGMSGCGTRASRPATVASPAAAIEPAEPPLQLHPGPGTEVVGTFVLASPAKITAKLNELSKGLGLPLQLGDSLKVVLAAQLEAKVNLVAASPLLARLAPDKPAVAVVTHANGRWGICAALPFRDSTSARDAREALGTRGTSQDGAVERRMPEGGTIWTGLSGSTLLVAPTRDSLLAGAAAAVARQTERVGVDATVTVHVDALMRATAKTPETMMSSLQATIAAATAQAQATPRKRGKATGTKNADAPIFTPEMAQMMTNIGKLTGRAWAQTRALHFTFNVSNETGIVIRTEIEPVAGSALAKRIATARASAYVLDPTLPIRDDRTFVMAWGSLDFLNPMMRAMFAGPGKVAARRLAVFEGYAKDFTGGGSCTGDPSVFPPASTCTWELKAGTTPARALDRHANFLNVVDDMVLGIAGGRIPRARIRRKGDVLEIERRLPPASDNTEKARMVREAMRGQPQKHLITVRGGKVLQLAGGDVDKRLANWAAPPGQKTPPGLAAALARTASYQMVFFIDLVPIITKSVESGQNPATKQFAAMLAALPALKTLRAPLVFGVSATDHLAFEIQVPFATLRNTADVMRPFMGIMGPGAAAPTGGANDPKAARAVAIRRAMQAGNAPAKGPASAPVTIVMFADFQDPFSARVQKTLDDLQATYPKEVRIVWKNLPLPFHGHAALAAEAALAAHEQGKFWQMHARLFANQKGLDPVALIEHARAIGLDMAKFMQALDTLRYRKVVEGDARLAAEAGITGTPGFLVNEKPLIGAQPLDVFRRAVEQALGRAPPGNPAVPTRQPETFRPQPPPPSPAAIKRAMDVGSAPAKGEPTAPVTMVMFANFQCPFSARVQSTLAEVQAAFPKDLRIVWKNLPLPSHAHAALAAEAALAAHEQGKFWQMHDRLFNNQNALDPASLEIHAAAISLDMQRFKAALNERRFRKIVEADTRIADDAGVRSTPTFLINGVAVRGAQPTYNFMIQVNRELARAKGLPVPPPEAATTDAMNPERIWPSPRVALPDDTLGPQFRVSFPTSGAPVLGPASAPVEVLFLNDYSWGANWRYKVVVDGLRKTYGDAIRIVAIPMASDRYNNKPVSTLVAETAWAAHAQGKFWELHEKLFAEPLPSEVDRPILNRYAGEAGLNVGMLNDALNSETYRSRVIEDTDRRDKAGLGPSTTFVVDGRSAWGTVALVALIDAALKKAGRPVPALPPVAVTSSESLDGFGVTTAQRFYLEPRGEPRTSSLERFLSPMIERDLRGADSTIRSVRVDCKIEACRVQWAPGRVPPTVIGKFLKYVFHGAIPRLPPLLSSKPEVYLSMFTARARVIGPNPTPPNTATLTQLSDEDAARIRSTRAGVLYSLRTGRTKIDGLPVEGLPRD